MAKRRSLTPLLVLGSAAALGAAVWFSRRRSPVGWADSGWTVQEGLTIPGQGIGAIEYTTTGSGTVPYTVSVTSLSVKFAGNLVNGGNTPVSVTVRLKAVSSGGALAAAAPSQAVTLQPGQTVAVSLAQAARDTDPTGTLTASIWVENAAGAKMSGSQVDSGALATISTPPALGLNGGFPFERQVRYVGGVDTPTPRQAFMILAAYSQPVGTQTLTKLREVRSGNFTIPTVQVPQIIVPVYDSDPPGYLAGGIKIFDAQSESLMTTDYGPERLGTHLWGLNMGAITATVTGSLQNYYAQVTTRLTITLRNQGDADMSIRYRTWVEARQGGTDLNFGEIPGFSDGWWSRTIPKGGSVQVSSNRGPAYAPDPYYSYIAYGNYIRANLVVEALSAGSVPSQMSWNAGAQQTVNF